MHGLQRTKFIANPPLYCYYEPQDNYKLKKIAKKHIMKKIMLSLLVALPLCQAADYAEYDTLSYLVPARTKKAKNPGVINWYKATQGIDWQTAKIIALTNKQLTALPDLFNASELQILDLMDNQLTALPTAFNPPKLKELWLNNNELTALPDPFNPPELGILDLNNNKIEDEEINRMIARFKDPNENYLPKLWLLNLNNNPITQNAQDRLRKALSGRKIDIRTKTKRESPKLPVCFYELQSEMLQAAQDSNFEKAISLADQLKQILKNLSCDHKNLQKNASIACFS